MKIDIQDEQDNPETRWLSKPIMSILYIDVKSSAYS